MNRLFHNIGMFFAPDGDTGGAGDGDKPTPEAVAIARAEKAEASLKDSQDALAKASANSETIEQMKKNIEGMSAQLGHTNRKEEEIPEGMQKETFDMLKGIGESLTELTGQTKANSAELAANKQVGLRNIVQKKFELSDDDMGFLQGETIEQLTESATMLVKRLKAAPEQESGSPNNPPLPNYGAPPDGNPLGSTSLPPVIKGKEAEQSESILQEFQKQQRR